MIPKRFTRRRHSFYREARPCGIRGPEGPKAPTPEAPKDMKASPEAQAKMEKKMEKPEAVRAAANGKIDKTQAILDRNSEVVTRNYTKMKAEKTAVYKSQGKENPEQEATVALREDVQKLNEQLQKFGVYIEVDEAAAKVQMKLLPTEARSDTQTARATEDRTYNSPNVQSSGNGMTRIGGASYRAQPTRPRGGSVSRGPEINRGPRTSAPYVPGRGPNIERRPRAMAPDYVPPQVKPNRMADQPIKPKEERKPGSTDTTKP